MTEAVVETLKPISEKYAYLLDNQDYLEKIYRSGAEKAQLVAAKTLADVYDKIGFIR